MSQARLMRSDSDRMIAGVCGGIASYLGIDSIFVRLGFLLLLLASGVGFVLYIILMIIMPRESTADRPSKQVFQDNIDEYGDGLTNNVSRIRKHPQGRSIAAGLLILLGFYLLLNNLGLLSWLSGGTFWAAALIALGIYILIRRSR